MPNIVNGLGQVKVGVRTQNAVISPTYLLDTYSGASAAYSLRKLRTDYTGSAIRVRRSNDNTTLDVGFDASGNLDTTSMLNFVGGQNLYLPSEDLSGLNWWGNGVNRTSNTGVAPDGITPANLLSEQSTLNSHNLSYSVGLSITAGKAVNHSVYLKKGPGSNAPDIISLYVGNATFNMRAVFNISTGQVLNTTNGSASGFEVLITDAGNGWWRCSIGGTLPHTTTQNFLLLTEFCNNVNSTTRQVYLGNVNANVYVWGLQYSNTNSVQPYSKTTTLTAGNGFISIWYDQSGNDLSLYQVTSSKQPQIVSNGSIFKSSGKPSVLFNGTTSEFTPQLISLSPNNCTLFSVFEIASTYLTNVEYPLFGLTNWYGIKFGVTNNKYFMIDKPTSDSVSLLSTNNISTGPKVGTTLFSSTTDKFRVNGSEVISGNAGTYGGAGSFLLGRSYLSKFWFGNISEMVIYNSNQTTNFTPIESNVNSYYSIY
jgi:hypothetical protein